MTNPQGDSLSITDLTLQVTSGPNNNTVCIHQNATASPGTLLSQCGFLALHDSVSGNLAPGSNTARGFIYDACGALVASGTYANWYEPATGGLQTGDAVGGVTFTVPYTNNWCWGTWTDTLSFTENFTDGQSLTDTLTTTFSTVAPPPTQPVEATYGNPAASPDGSKVCGDPRYEFQPRVQAACAALVADPVNLASGAVTATVTDAQMPALGEPFRFVRSYTSLDTTTSELGRGWTDTYNASLSFGTGQITFRAGSGAQTIFTQQTDGSYLAPVWNTTSLRVVVGGYDVVTNDQIHYAFDGQGRLLSIKDRNGQGVSLAYDAQGVRSTATDSAGRQVTFAYTGGLLTRVTLPDGRFVAYGYTSGLLTSVTDIAGNSYSYAYDGGSRLQSETDQDLHRVFFNVYGSDGRISTQTDATNHITRYAYNSSGLVTVTDARNVVWRYQFTGGTSLAYKQDTYGNKFSYGYDSTTGDLTSVTDPNGHVESMTYDARHNMLTRTAPTPLSYQEVWTYNQFNDPLTYKDGRGFQTDYGYDTAGNLLTSTGPDPDGTDPLGRPVTTYTRDPAGTGLVMAVQDPRGKSTTYAYDPTTHQETSVTTPLGEKTSFTYDLTGRLATSVEPRGNAQGANPLDYTTTYTWDGNDHLKQLNSPDPDGAGPQTALVTRWLWDPAGNLQTYTDAIGNQTDYSYDPANQPLSVTGADPDGVGPLTRPVTSYTYDEVGDIATRTVGGTHQTLYGYDSDDRLTSVTSPTGQLWTYTYDPDSNVLTRTDANGNATTTTGDGVTTYGYDALGRLASINYSDSTPAVTYSYDANDNLTQLTDGSGTEVRAFDGLNQLIVVGRGAASFAYARDENGNIIKVTYPDGTVITKTYDDDSRLSSVASGGLTTTYGYDAASNLTATTLPSANGYVETRTYDRAGRLTSVGNKKGTTTLSSYGYTLDAAGDPTTIAITRGSTNETDTYTYDGLNRVTGVCYKASCPLGTDPFIRWTYDGVGNRLTQATPSGTTNYTYNAADQLTQAGATAYTYDANGNEKTGGTSSLSYDLENRLVSSSVAGTTTTYTYDGLGKRLQASTGSANNKKTNFLWDISGSLPQIALERDGGNSLVRRYIYGARRLTMSTGSSPYYYHYDPLGSTVNLTSSSGASEWTDAYDPFGTVHSETKNDTKAPTNVFKFAGEYLDSTGLYHLRARQLDPTSGRFLTTDPVVPKRNASYMSSYAYANDSPTTFIDPTGMGAVGNTCGSVVCFLKSSDGAKAIGCGLGVGGLVVIGAGAVVLADVGASLGASAVYATAANGVFDNVETIGAGSVVGGTVLSKGVPCL